MGLTSARTIVNNLKLLRSPQAQGDEITITCWTGKVLFKGPCTSPEVDAVLDANRCDCKEVESCKSCDGTGYKGDFEVYWLNENDTRNVYEFINY